jgi:DNA gyrase subunit B
MLHTMGSDATVSAAVDPRSDKQVLTVSRRVHGNTRSSVISADFVHGADYGALREAALTFEGLITEGAKVQRGKLKEGDDANDKVKEQAVTDFREAMQWLLTQAEGSMSRQRYKGLGEMNPSQLWETTMDPTVRRLLRVQIEDAIEADRVFTMLMGDEVEPRRDFIESNALRAANIDV